MKKEWADILLYTMLREQLREKKHWLYLVGGVVLGLGGAFTLSMLGGTSGPSWYPNDTRQDSSAYTFINPLLECGEDSSIQISNKSLELLGGSIRNLISGMKTSGEISDASVYFRELNDGSTIGINQDEYFTPGSLLKVPLALSLYLKSESDPEFLKKKIMFDGGTAPATEHFTSQVITPGSVYSVEDLVDATLMYSDNNAALILTQLLDKNELDKSYSDLGIKTPVSGSDYSMTVRTYASFFRILYNATLLNRTDSEHLLSILSKATFTQGIVAGVPANVVVAHKFGERAYSGAASQGVQLHDCGIVYKPNDPYLLCVMMRGADYETLAKNIQEISALVYNSAHPL